MKLICSSERKSTDLSLQLGKTNYSYGFVEMRFISAFARMGWDATFVDAPESLKHPMAYEALVGAPPSQVTHIAFRSMENFRTAAGARNICHFAWEFDEIRTDSLIGEPIVGNQKYMLSLADEIWVPCRYTYDILLRNGLGNVHIVPTPICSGEPRDRMAFETALDLIGGVPAVPMNMALMLSMDDNVEITAGHLTALANHPAIAQRGAGGRIFLLVCNPHDHRKNLLNTIDGFLMGSGPRDVLIIKLIVSNKQDYLLHSLWYALLPHLHGAFAMFSERVMFVFDYLSEQRMEALYSLADFYLSASHCEGYNMPLLEAMSFGTVPVSNCNTAMTDYIDADNAVVIADKFYMGFLPGMAGDISGKAYGVAVSTRYDIGRAVRTARALDDAIYSAKAQAARDVTMARHSEKAVIPIVRERLGLPEDARAPAEA